MLMNFIRFLIFEMQYCLNIDMIVIVWEMLEENLKRSIKKDATGSQYHYDSEDVPPILRNEVCELLAVELQKLYERDDIPEAILMKAKIMKLLECVLTCCENPNRIVTRKFLALKLP
jgi:hypothetical protein